MCSLSQQCAGDTPEALPADAAGEADEGSASKRWDCTLRKGGLLNGQTGEVRELDCKRWACVEHGPKLAWRWRQRVAMVPWRLMLTLSLVPEDRGAARAAWGKMAKWLRARGMTTYLRVMELGSEHGMRHWHVLVDAPWIEQAELSRRAAEVGLGSVVWVSRVKDRAGATYYLLGYVFKSLGVTDERQEGWRKVTVSRNIPSWPRVVEARADYKAERDPGHWMVVGGDYRHMPDALTYAAFLEKQEAIHGNGGNDMGKAPGTGADDREVDLVRDGSEDGVCV